MSVMEKVFGAIGFGNNSNPSPSNVPQQNTPQNLPASPAQTTTPNNGVVPNSGNPNPSNTQENNNPTGEAVKSPLDQFTDLWKNDPKQLEGNQQQTFNVDHAKLMEAASRVDFSKVITPDQLKAIGTGGEGAITAFSEALNKVAQTVYAQSAVASTEIVKQAISQAETKFASQVPSIVKRHQVSDGLRTDNPALSHPAAQPIITALEQQFTSKYPNATSSELRALATSYLTSFNDAVNPQKQALDTTTGNKGETDWSKFLE